MPCRSVSSGLYGVYNTAESYSDRKKSSVLDIGEKKRNYPTTDPHVTLPTRLYTTVLSTAIFYLTSIPYDSLPLSLYIYDPRINLGHSPPSDTTGVRQCQ